MISRNIRTNSRMFFFKIISMTRRRKISRKFLKRISLIDLRTKKMKNVEKISTCRKILSPSDKLLTHFPSIFFSWPKKKKENTIPRDNCDETTNAL